MHQHSPRQFAEDEILRMSDIVSRIDEITGRPTLTLGTPSPATEMPTEVADVVINAKAGIDEVRKMLDELDRKLVDQAADTTYSMKRMVEVGKEAKAEAERLRALVEQWSHKAQPPRT
jgi:hypothetical protein